MLSDPVLAFIKGFRLRGSLENLKRAALSKFDSVLMSKAKRALWESECSSILSAAGLTFQSRRGSEKRSQASADLEDILIAFDKLDDNENLPEIFCEASDLVRLPPIVTDSCTEQVLRNGSSLEDVKVKLESLGLGVSNLSAKLVSIESQIAALPCGGAIAGNGGSSHPSSSSSHPPNPKASNKSSVDLRENLIVFGIKESRVLSDTMASVKNMLEFLTGRSTPVKDMYRIGRFKKPGDTQSTSTRPRPIVLKLCSPWDRRLVLANRFNLKGYDVEGLFVREDLSPEARQQRREKFASRRRDSSSTLQAMSMTTGDSLTANTNTSEHSGLLSDLPVHSQ